jgi:hypothetical protein
MIAKSVKWVGWNLILVGIFSLCHQECVGGSFNVQFSKGDVNVNLPLISVRYRDWVLVTSYLHIRVEYFLPIRDNCSSERLLFHSLLSNWKWTNISPHLYHKSSCCPSGSICSTCLTFVLQFLSVHALPDWLAVVRCSQCGIGVVAHYSLKFCSYVVLSILV